MLYTYLCYHSAIFDTHSFQLYMCTFIYLTVILSSCPTATILTVCWALYLTPLSRHPACRRRPRLHVRLHPAADHGDASTKSRSSCIFESLYIREHSYTCLSLRLNALHPFVLVVPLYLTPLSRHLACRRRPRLHVRLHQAADHGDASTKSRSSCIFESLYIREHSYTCLSLRLNALHPFVLPIPCFSFIHYITPPYLMFDASHFKILLLR